MHQIKAILTYQFLQAIYSGATLRLTRTGHFLLSSEQGLAGKKTLVNIFQDDLSLEYGDHPLSRYSVEWQPHDTHLLSVGNPQIVTAL